ncbi:MAG: aldehyde dehydrogenase family protein [Nitrospirae bacterium]|nr:aldehyde dehydrogenase family protein [Nitrospirota bacterium]
MLIDGRSATARDRFEVLNPATLEVVDTAPRATADDLDRAVQAAKRAFKTWSRDADARRKALTRCSELIQEHMQELATLLTREQGKPMLEASGEIFFGSMFFSYYAGLETSDTILKDDGAQKVLITRRPLGVIGSITPWNFPLGILCWKVAPALLAGNTVVCKPASYTPLSTVRLLQIIASVLPPGVINAVTGPGAIGAAMAKHPDIRKISFTGSTEVGKSVMRDGADTIKRLTLELGGNDAAILLDDFSVEKAMKHVYRNAFFNAGQVCIAIKRLYAHEKIYDRVVEKMSELAGRAKVGDGLNPENEMGPVNNRPQLERVSTLVEDARKRGARIAAGGIRPEGKGYFYRPTIVADLDDSFDLVSQEQFGPAVPILKYSDLDEVVDRANRSPFGLGASVWSTNRERAEEVASRLEAGTTWVNQHLWLETDVLYGGIKESGIGHEMGRWGFEDMVNLQVISVRK